MAVGHGGHRRAALRGHVRRRILGAGRKRRGLEMSQPRSDLLDRFLRDHLQLDQALGHGRRRIGRWHERHVKCLAGERGVHVQLAAELGNDLPRLRVCVGRHAGGGDDSPVGLRERRSRSYGCPYCTAAIEEVCTKRSTPSATCFPRVTVPALAVAHLQSEQRIDGVVCQGQGCEWRAHQDCVEDHLGPSRYALSAIRAPPAEPEHDARRHRCFEQE